MIVFWINLFLTFVNLIFLVRISIFLVNFASSVRNRLDSLEAEPPMAQPRNSYSENEESGLVDLKGVYNYDARYTHPGE
ncbi:MAG: hypothetical protein DWQ19_10510 [Crenarchaeota archaeon]|nr:MAG: hypothetical protein DWQ19_10510 [Thermoproteota archaeon]